MENLRKNSRTIVRELGFNNCENNYEGLSLLQSHLLIEVSQYPGITQKKVTQKLISNKSNISSAVNTLCKKGLINLQKDPYDSRGNILFISENGQIILNKISIKVNQILEEALNFLDVNQRKLVNDSFELLANAMKLARVSQNYVISPLKPLDNKKMRQIILDNLTAYNANRDGFASHDPCLNDLFTEFNKSGSHYVTIKDKKGKLYGGVGIATPNGSLSPHYCELQKMYLSEESQGLGLGNILLNHIINIARKMGYKYCYLETLSTMNLAVNLYVKNNFKKLDKPMFNTGHHACDTWMLLEL